MKIATVVGARPQFIKAAVVSQELRKKHTEVLIHTGQHYDYNMSQQFFDELGIPEADYNLGISGGTHGQMTGRMLIAVEEVLMKEKPDWLLVYGDTNSTLAGALGAAKLHIPVCHVEAGVRTYKQNNPEELNRICTDHISTLLMTGTQGSMNCLKKEGLSERSVFVGDPMYDAFLEYSGKINLNDIKLTGLNGTLIPIPEKYYYLTCHREENTKDDSVLLEIFRAAEQLDELVVYPVHPRNKYRAVMLKKKYGFRNLLLTEPVGYLESICLVNHAEKIVTDSGGLQREAFFAGKKCVTVLDFVCWPETMVEGRNELAEPVAKDILEKLKHPQKIMGTYRPFGDGHSAEKIVKAIESYNMGSAKK